MQGCSCFSVQADRLLPLGALLVLGGSQLPFCWWSGVLAMLRTTLRTCQ